MKTITLQLYTFDELSEEVQKEIIERERWNIMDQCMEAYGSDYVTSLRTFVKSPEEGEICAVFVNEFWDRSKTKLTSYMHIGQHAGCSPDILKNWPLATEQEYRSLLEELNTIGYENIKIIQSRIH